MWEVATTHATAHTAHGNADLHYRGRRRHERGPCQPTEYIHPRAHPRKANPKQVIMGWHTPALLQAHLPGSSPSPGSAQASGHTFSRPETPVPTAKQYMPESCPGRTSLNYRSMANTEQFRFITCSHAAAKNHWSVHRGYHPSTTRRPGLFGLNCSTWPTLNN